ncbi:thioesterase family protein [Brasilonema sp. UFV-L1]|uniref:acyl-CoA thioesterase n=1 Tax=Brasilonema sp. UFV-L1 TaxID=2234130 RepID=UPI00145E453D|nr:thioesterase family protein [Brasilonema sp. UFV-L1]NMG09100.1 acyl-CoA thioesterase [Brasilonema sp. UFV-L1]
MQIFKTLLRVRHYEMDALGHVNNAVYQNYLEQAAIEHSEHLGLTFDVYRELGGVFVMRRVEIEYLHPAVASDTLEIMTWLREMRGTRAYRQYEIRKQNQEDLLVTAEALWVWVDPKTMRPRGIPKMLLEKFLQI